MFAVPFDQIAPIIGRSQDATKMLASRARRRVQAASTEPESDPARQRRIVAAFLAASRAGDFAALLELLDPGVIARADASVVRAGAEAEVRGPDAVAAVFAGRALGAQLALVNGSAAIVWIHDGTLRVVFSFTVSGERISQIDLLGDQDRLSGMDVTVL